GGRVTGDLASGRLLRFDAALRERYALLGRAAASAQAEARVPPLRELPRSLRYLDATDDPEHWINRAVAAYIMGDGRRMRVAE
ncbi:MAG: hypothetical protein ACK4L7_07545, partial [Flavobacteriales bacterium]